MGRLHERSNNFHSPWTVDTPRKCRSSANSLRVRQGSTTQATPLYLAGHIFEFGPSVFHTLGLHILSTPRPTVKITFVSVIATTRTSYQPEVEYPAKRWKTRAPSVIQTASSQEPASSLLQPVSVLLVEGMWTELNFLSTSTINPQALGHPVSWIDSSGEARIIDISGTSFIAFSRWRHQSAPTQAKRAHLRHTFIPPIKNDAIPKEALIQPMFQVQFQVQLRFHGSCYARHGGPRKPQLRSFRGPDRVSLLTKSTRRRVGLYNPADFILRSL